MWILGAPLVLALIDWMRTPTPRNRTQYTGDDRVNTPTDARAK